MDLKKLFQKILNVSQEDTIPQAVTNSFNSQFNSPLNTEWHKSEEFYEAVFYKNELEHIAKYKADGTQVSLKVNLPLEDIPLKIYGKIKCHGEVMNAIKIINNNNKENFEFIVRDKNLKRFSFLLDDKGEIREEKIV